MASVGQVSLLPQYITPLNIMVNIYPTWPINFIATLLIIILGWLICQISPCFEVYLYPREADYFEVSKKRVEPQS
jgi:hypothetical protein